MVSVENFVGSGDRKCWLEGGCSGGWKCVQEGNGAGGRNCWEQGSCCGGRKCWQMEEDGGGGKKNVGRREVVSENVDRKEVVIVT